MRKKTIIPNNKNERKLDEYLKKPKPVGRPRKYKKGSQRMPDGYKKFTFIAKVKQVNAMAEVAERDQKKIQDVYAEAIEKYLDKEDNINMDFVTLSERIDSWNSQ